MTKVRNIYKAAVVALLMVCVPYMADAQKWAVSTNAIAWAGLGTINAEGSMGVSQHFTVGAGFVANPWEIESPTGVQIRNRQYGGYMGAKYWPWHVYSDWWIGAKVQYKHFDQVGLLTSRPVKGDAAGAGLSAGYTILISSRINLDFGLGVWGGRLFNCSSDRKWFLFPDNVMVSLAYIF